MSVLGIVLASALAASPAPDERPTHPVPPYLPRSVNVGLFWNEPTLTAHIRLNWEIELFEQDQHAFMALVMVGTGIGFSLPPLLLALYQHVAVAGIEYQNTGALFQWGFALGIGPVWYRAAFDPKAPYRFENRVLGYVEGRGLAGVKVARNAVVGVYVGFASPWENNENFPANIYVGGLQFGIYTSWR